MGPDADRWPTEPAIAVDRLMTVGGSESPGGSLNQVTFSVMVGELTVLSGPSGAGPSTVLSVLAGQGPLVTGRVRARGRTVDVESAPGRLTVVGLASPETVARSMAGRATLSDVEPVRAAAALRRPQIFRPRSLGQRPLGRATLMFVTLGQELANNPAVLAADHPTRLIHKGAVLVR